MRWKVPAMLASALILGGAISCRSFSGSADGKPQDRRPPEAPTGSHQETDQTRAELSPRRPQEISSVFPTENSIVRPTAEVGASFLLKGAMLKDGQIDTPAFSLALDGEDLTAELRFRGTMDFPQSHGTLSYRPGAPLSLGPHEATVSFPDERGNPKTYSWAFDTQQEPR